MYLSPGDIDKARQLKLIYFADRRISDGRKALVSARFSYFTKNYEEAKNKVIEAIHLSGAEPLDAINMLGRCLLRLGDEINALKCFEKAQSISPQNIKRLCDIAEIHLTTGKERAAVDTIGKAEKMDAKNADVLLTGVKIAASTNNIQLARKLIEQVGSKMEFVTYMNNRAIALTKAGKTEEGFALYRRALETLPPSDNNLRSILTYNLGLAHVRTNDLSSAKSVLEESIRLGSLLVLKRAQSLISKVQHAMARANS